MGQEASKFAHKKKIFEYDFTEEAKITITYFEKQTALSFNLSLAILNPNNFL